MPSRHTSLKSLLEMVQEREPGREVILLPETASMATIPFFCGASLPKGYTRMPKTIGLSVVPIFVTSRDTAPFGPGLPPDATESGRVRNQMLHEMIRLGPLRR